MLTALIIVVIFIVHLEGMFLTWSLVEDGALEERIGKTGTEIFILFWEPALFGVVILAVIAGVLQWQYQKLQTLEDCNGGFTKSSRPGDAGGGYYICNHCGEEFYFEKKIEEKIQNDLEVYRLPHKRQSEKLKEFQNSWKYRLIHY